MRLHRPQLIGIFIILLAPLIWLAWQWQDSQEAAQTAVLPTLAPTAPPLPTFTAEPTETAVPTEPATVAPTHTPPPTATDEPTITPAPTTQSTATPSPTSTAVPINRACPDPAPLKPFYDRYVVSDTIWPTPDPALADPHFWLTKPLPGGGRFLINLNFPYGYDLNGRLLLHNGVDSAEPLGTPVLAVADGTVVVAQDDLNDWYGWRCDWYGHLVVIELDRTYQDKPLYALYGHVLNINVAAGQRVQTGEQVAEVGFGGAAKTPHLHFELRLGKNEFDSTLNPMLWIDPGATRGVIVGRLLDLDGRPWRGVGLSLIGKSEDASAGNTWTYLDDPRHYINPDPGYAENFVFADVKPGEYDVFTKIQGVEYRAPVTVTAGGIGRVEIITEAYRIPTATPPATATSVP
ncbi:MAG: peptidoglycan DD-metalloendopeptidase family protein [Chloroflexi bacterium]|nr:peptidoglycan DD-metalloendopeptidase family protein [Chloroflexota bacterium]